MPIPAPPRSKSVQDIFWHLLSKEERQQMIHEFQTAKDHDLKFACAYFEREFGIHNLSNESPKT